MQYVLVIEIVSFQIRMTIPSLQVEIAVRNGYRHLDLAMIYKNQDEVCIDLTVLLRCSIIYLNI